MRKIKQFISKIRLVNKMMKYSFVLIVEDNVEHPLVVHKVRGRRHFDLLTKKIYYKNLI